jgi:molybdopterin-guanine dinucleotide biosynthesis protein A
MITLTAVLFVGGLSQRMGVEKGKLIIGGEPLWIRQLHLLKELEPNAIWVSARARPIWCPQEIKVVLDAPPSRGPLSGLAAVLRESQTSHVLALAVDLPQMKAVLLRTLWSLAQPGCGVIPSNHDWLEPLCAIYPVEAAANAATALEREELSMQRFTKILIRGKRMRTYPLNDSERGLFYNLNTPADLQKCRIDAD